MKDKRKVKRRKKGVSKPDKIFLRTAEALSDDVGEGIIRIDPKDIALLGAKIGDVVWIKGKRKTVCQVMPLYKDKRGKGIVQIDSITRENAQIGLNEEVEIRKCHCKTAEVLSLVPLEPLNLIDEEKDLKFLARMLEGQALVEEDRVRVNIFTHTKDFRVVHTLPAGPLVVKSTTQVKLSELKSKEKEKEGSRVGYEDIGGLDKEIQKVREMIEIPLKYPQVFSRLGINPPKGILMSGPPGTGKTLIARVVAQESDAHFMYINGPEIMGKYYGESETRLRAVFQEAARNVPSIVFMDELEAIAPKREELGTEKQVEKRVVAQLLALMDGLEARGEIIVIAATNIPNAIDPALRRPGRFDREITIGVPDKKGREKILKIHTRSMPLSKDVNLKELAEVTHGFVGADLEALCKEAAMAALRKVIPEIDMQSGIIPYETLLKLVVTKADFIEVLSEIEPAALKEFYLESPDVSWEDVGNLEDIKKELTKAVEWPLKHSGLLEHVKARPAKGILLYGAPGTGKTLIAKASATESQANFISVKGPALLSKYVGESEKGVRSVFKKARQTSPCIIFFDEFDSLAPIRRSQGSDSHVSEQVVSQLLTEIDGIEELRGVVIMAATNRIDMIDPALLRPGRFDLLLEMPIPAKKTREKIFYVHTRGKPIARDVNVNRLATVTKGCVGADIEAICRKAAELAIDNFLSHKHRPKPEDYSHCVIKKKHFQQAIQDIMSALRLRIHKKNGFKRKEL